MEFALLGPLEARSKDRVAALGGPRQQALLAVLLLARGRVVSRAAIVDALWGQDPPAAADHTLDTYVSRLRASLRSLTDEALLITQAPGYRLAIDDSSLDLVKFEELTAAARRAAADGDPDLAVSLFSDALGLWKADALAGLDGIPFVEAETARLEELRLTALEDRCEAALASSTQPDPLSELEALTAAHPLRERLQGLLMLARYRAGRQAQALSGYQAYRKLLDEELGIEPGPALRHVYEQILRQDETLLGVEAPPVAPPSGARRGSRRGRVMVGGALGAVALGLVVFAAVRLSPGDDTSGATAPVVADGIGVYVPGDEAKLTGVALPVRPDGLAVVGDTVWLTSTAGRALLATDRDTHALRGEVTLPADPGDLVAGDRAVWVSEPAAGVVVRVDPTTRRIVQTVSLGNAPSALAYGDGRIWVTDTHDRSLTSIDATTGAVLKTDTLSVIPSDIAIAAGSVWITSAQQGVVLRRALDGRDQVSIAVGHGASLLAAAPDGVWVANSEDGTVSHVDAVREAVRATVNLAETPTGLALLGDRLWVSTARTGHLVALDTRSGAVVDSVQVASHPGALLTVGSELWFGNTSDTAVRGGTLRIAVAYDNVDIDPAVAVVLFPPQLLGMTNDGLVTLRHAIGIRGTEVVPDLAQSLPTISDGGRTIRFALRRDIKYSTGTPVRPEDFRWALERTLRIRGSYAGLYANIVGAGACLERPARCDLSRGVVADRASYTVTFHLVRPDPDLLYKLTLPAAYAVPDGVGPSFVSSEPVPATGPYVIERHAPGDELVLARNPNFHEWSPEAQPDGYPDRIVYKFGYTDRSVVSAIGADRADWGIYRFPFAPPGPLVEQLSARHASQVHVNPLNEVQWFVLRVNAPPFDKVEVRRAVNLAVDRNRIVELIGGPAVGTPTCQILPPGIPGHTPYCPYTEAPSDDGRYIGPRLAEARRLVAASGARGTRVIVATEPDNPVADYLVSVLRSIGLDAHPRVTHDPATRYARDVGVSDEGWVADYPSPTEFLPLLLSCQPDGTSAGGGFCSRALDQAMDDAQDTMMRNPAKGAQKWAELDRRFTDLAVWVPTVNLNAVGYVSTRTHNYQFHPQWGLMVDQLWLDRH